MQANRISSDRVRNHFSYSWWKYLLLVIAAVMGWNIIYSTTAYKPPADKRMTVYFVTHSIDSENTAVIREKILEKSLAEEATDAARRYNPRVLYQMMDNFAKLGIPQQITEMSIPSYTLEREDELIQAELTKHLYRCFFSHPAMEAVIYWNLVDGYAASAPAGDMTRGENWFRAGFLRHDLSEKPVFLELKKLIHEEWQTELTVRAVDGTARFRGFYGDYDLTVYANGKQIPVKISLSKSSKNQFTVTLWPPPRLLSKNLSN